MISELDIREKMAAALASRLPVADFARWIMSNSWNMHSDSSAIAISLASEILALLAERDAYALSDPAFLRELQKLYDSTIPVAVEEFTDKVSTSSSAQGEAEIVTSEQLTAPRWVILFRSPSPSVQARVTV